MTQLEDISAMGQAHIGEAIELYAYINNEASLWSRIETYYRMAERQMKRNEYVPEYLEAELRFVVLDGARRYVRDYCPHGAKVGFPFAIRRECAKLMVKNFETEIGYGNGWL